MKTGDVARALDVTRKTVANWTTIPDLRPFFSEGAMRGADEGQTSQRDFNEADLYVLNTIRVHKTRTNTWSDVARLLKEGKREMELPATALLMESISPVEQMQMLMVARKDLEIMRARNEDLEAQLEKSEAEKGDLREEIRKLDRQIAVLEYRLEQAEGDDDEK